MFQHHQGNNIAVTGLVFIDVDSIGQIDDVLAPAHCLWTSVFWHSAGRSYPDELVLREFPSALPATPSLFEGAGVVGPKASGSHDGPAFRIGEDGPNQQAGHAASSCIAMTIQTAVCLPGKLGRGVRRLCGSL